MTRILITLSIFLSLSFFASAQFSKGSILLGGQLSFSSSKTGSANIVNPEQKTSNGIFSISIGKAIKENAVFGIDLSYNPYSMNNYYTYTSGPLDYSNNSYSIGVFYRVYKSLGKDFFLFGQVGAAYTGSNESGKDNTGNKVVTGSGSGGSVYFMPGISYKISKNFFLDLTIPYLFLANYNSQKSTTVGQQPNTNDHFSISTSLSSNPLTDLGIGFRLSL
jgi:hypothetical protein